MSIRAKTRGRVFYTFILLVLFAARVFVQPYFSLISDCDETFNYWEPLNLLVRGFGKQTWEYSPVYSIRSWSFLFPLAAVLKPLNQYVRTKVNLFYVARAVLGLTSFALEYSLSKEIAALMSLHVSNMWLLFQLFNPGWFHASVEFLPSSFAMLASLGYLKYTLRYLASGQETPFVKSIFFVLLGGIVGWPFSLVLGVTNVIHYTATHRFIDTLRAGFSSSLLLMLVTCIVTAIDSILYGKLSVVPLNIVMYNIISADEKSGPNIFGIEPWHYYFQNLLLNFPLTTLSFAIAGLAQFSIWPISGSLFIWFNIFVAQPHKEERFLYPVYAIISLLGAVGLFNTTNFSHHRVIRKVVRTMIFVGTFVQALCRILAISNNYTAPIDVYAHLPESVTSKVVCTGREWYHFPTSLILPDNYRLGFVKSGFDGLLPGDFLELGTLTEKISAIPSGMNNQNIFHSSKLVDINTCDYYVDTNTVASNPNDSVNPVESEVWKPLYCKPFIDVEGSKFLGRAFQIPARLIAILPQRIQKIIFKYYEVRYVDYCLYSRGEQEIMEV